MSAVLTDDLTVDQTTLARILGVSPRTVRRMEREGLSVARVSDPGDAPLYDVPRAVQWVIESRDPESDDELLDARTRKMRADAELREDELRTKRGELVPVHEVLDRVRKPLEAVDGQLRSAPRRLARDWAARLGVTQGEAIALIGDLVEEVRADVRQVFEGDAEGAAA